MIAPSQLCPAPILELPPPRADELLLWSCKPRLIQAQAPLAGLIAWGAGLGMAPVGWAQHLPQGECLAWGQGQWNAWSEALRPLVPEGSWRNEQFAITLPNGHRLRGAGGEVLGLERSLFRPLGLFSHSVQLNVFRPDGSLWCGQRAAHKAIDPGLWDAAAAGGLGALEEPSLAVVREAYEECGLRLKDTPRYRGCIRLVRWSAQGLQRERVWVFEALAPEDFRPLPIDGEVSTFEALRLPEIAQRWSRDEFNFEAAAALIGYPPRSVP